MVDDYEDRVVYLLRMVSTALNHRLDRELRAFSLNRAQLGALAQLGRDHPCALSGAVLGQRAGVTAQSMSSAIASLLERGLVKRSPHPTHGRVLDVRITDAGLELIERVQVATRRLEDRAVASLSGEQQRALRTILRSMMVDLDLYVPSGLGAGAPPAGGAGPRRR